MPTGKGQIRSLLRFLKFQWKSSQTLRTSAGFAGLKSIGLAPFVLYFLFPYFKLLCEILLGRPRDLENGERVTAVLLSYQRPANMDLLLTSLLKLPFLEKIILSNNNPDCNISDWITVSDSRLEIITQPKPSFAGIRFPIATKHYSKYYLMIDDDIFPSPRQISNLIRFLIKDPTVPHGAQGETYLGRAGRARMCGFQLGWFGKEMRPDVINCLYAFTREHLDEYFRLAGLAGIKDHAAFGNEDIVLSFCGSEKPWIHDLETLPRCITTSQKGIASWLTRQDFFQDRQLLYRQLAMIKGRPLPEGD